jgi:AbrB family looped-hinge helix DNA binding protein
MATPRTSRIVRPLRNGQITIPIDFRRRLGITEDSLLKVTLEGDELHIKPVTAEDQPKGSPWLKELYELFAPVHAEAAKYTEEEINAAIDEAIAAVRKNYAERGL